MSSIIADRLHNPIFIVGPGRSGTTLLRSILSAHSKIAIAPETHYLAHVEERGLAEGTPQDFDAFWEHYTQWVRFRDLGVSPARCLELMPEGSARSFKDVFAAVLLAYGETVGKDRVGEKTPGHSRFLSVLFDWFPDARVLAMARDPRAVVASQLKTPYVKARLTSFGLRGGFISGSRLHEVAHFAANWLTVVERRLAQWIGDPRLHLLSYENLAREPEREVRSICEFLGEGYEPDMLVRRTGRSAPAAAVREPAFEQWREEHHRKSQQAISAASLDRWRGELSPLEIATIEGFCTNEMTARGYELTTSAPAQVAGAALARTLTRVGAAENRLRGRDTRSYSRARAAGLRSAASSGAVPSR